MTWQLDIWGTKASDAVFHFILLYEQMSLLWGIIESHEICPSSTRGISRIQPLRSSSICSILLILTDYFASTVSLARDLKTISSMEVIAHKNKTN